MTQKSYFNEWLIKYYGGGTPKDGLSSFINNLLIETEQVELPINLSKIARLIGVNPKPIYQDQPSNGQIKLVNSEFRISLKMKSGKAPNITSYEYPRLRFAYAHELVHCFFYDHSKKPPERIAPIPKGREEEFICNMGANMLILPYRIVDTYLKTSTFFDINYAAQKLSKKAHASLFSCYLFLVNHEYYLIKLNKIYILSLTSEGFRKRSFRKPRCLVSAVYLNNNEKIDFLPVYKGLDSISESWSLINFHKKLEDDSKINEVLVKNEVIDYNKKRILLNGKHMRLPNSNYIWSDLDIIEL